MSSHISYKFKRTFLPIFSVAFILVAATVLREESNPDWFGYMKIFEDGAWLAKEDRDIGFLTILNLYKALFGANYEVFRLSVSIYFSIFVLYLTRGRLLSFGAKPASFFALFLTVVCFTSVRFSIQIREGIAITFIMYAFAIILSEASNTLRGRFFSFLLLLLGVSIHSGVLLFFAFYLVALALEKIYNISKKSYYKKFFVFNLVVTLLAFLFPFFYSTLSELGLSFVSRLDKSVTVKFGLDKLVYWGIYGVLIFFLRKNVLDELEDFSDTALGRIYLKLLVQVLLKIVFIVLIVFIFLQFPATVVAAVSRLLNIIISVALLVLAFKKNSTYFLFAATILIIIDQVRIVQEAISTIDNL